MEWNISHPTGYKINFPLECGRKDSYEVLLGMLHCKSYYEIEI
jgi:hypothetical protein